MAQLTTQDAELINTALDLAITSAARAQKNARTKEIQNAYRKSEEDYLKLKLKLTEKQ